MPTVILGILNNANMSMKEVSNISNVPFSTLNNASKKPIETWSIRVLNAFAEGLKMKPSELLEELQPSTYKLEIDDKNQIIQGVYIPDIENYYAIRTVVEIEHLEGWNPTNTDIRYLHKQALDPDPSLVKEVDDVLKEYHVKTRRWSIQWE